MIYLLKLRDCVRFDDKNGFVMKNIFKNINKKSPKSGFTLVELAIVIVIIGLIIGGVMFGRDMVRMSEIRATIAQIEQFKAASNAFKLKYNCLAGDCINATSFLSGTSNGNGNDKIAGAVFQFNSNEYIYFWQHLALAGLIQGSYTTTVSGTTYQPDINFPSAKLGGGFGVWNIQAYAGGGAIGGGKLFPAQYGNTLLLGKQWVDASSSMPLIGIMSGFDARRIDTKYDDGLPAYGTIVTWQNTSGYSSSCSSTDVASTAVYLNTTTYSLSGIRCSLFFINAF